MTETERKHAPPDQMNIRLGAKYIQEFNTYMENHSGKKIDFIRDAITYWMSVDANPGDLMRRVQIAEDNARHAAERFTEIKQHCDERISDLNRIIEEKDARIDILTRQLSSSLAILSSQALSAVPAVPAAPAVPVTPDTAPAQKPAWTKEAKKSLQ